MEQRVCGEDGKFDLCPKTMLPGAEKSSTTSPAHVQKPGIAANRNLGLEIACQTPEKANEPLRAKMIDGGVNLPNKYKIISEFFDGMNCSFRLLSLRKRATTFQNITSQVEVLTKRKFTYGHLAQIKYILPEAIQIEKILVHDKKTLCMIPEMKIGLLFDVVKGHSEQSDFMALQQLFASRLLGFFTRHPQACDVPEAMLPEPFTQRSQVLAPEELSTDSLMECQPTSIECDVLSEKFLQCPSLTRHFSRKAVDGGTEKTELLASHGPLFSVSSNNLTKQDIIIRQQKEITGGWFESESGQHKEAPVVFSASSVVNSPVEQIKSSSTPSVKLSSSADCLMLETPAQLTPRRSMPSCEDKLKTQSSQKLMSCNKPTKRALCFYDSEHDNSAFDSIVNESRGKTVIDDDIIHPPEVIFKDGNVTGSGPLQEVKQDLGCLNDTCKKSQMGVAMSQPISSCLPELVALIHRIFKSVSCASVTREELLHKIIINSFDIVERREVEEQIELLEKMVPDWIYRKLTTGGDIMYSIEKALDLDSVRARVVCT